VHQSITLNGISAAKFNEIANAFTSTVAQLLNVNAPSIDVIRTEDGNNNARRRQRLLAGFAAATCSILYQVTTKNKAEAVRVASVMQSNMFLSEFTKLLNKMIQKDSSISSTYSITAVASSVPEVVPVDSAVSVDTDSSNEKTNVPAGKENLQNWVVVIIVLFVLAGVVVGGCVVYFRKGRGAVSKRKVQGIYQQNEDEHTSSVTDHKTQITQNKINKSTL